jgi:hypothetical protein
MSRVATPATRTAVCVGLLLAALPGCSKSEPVPLHDAGSSSAVAPPAAGCGAQPRPGFGDAAQAYAAYAEAINDARWCDAIHTFAPAQRAEVVMANFKGLAMLAGADNPKRVAHQTRFARFCKRHELGCGTPQSAAELAQHIMLRLPLDAILADVQALASRAGEQAYVDLMSGQAEVDAGALSKFQLPLRELRVDGDRATGKALQASGSESTFSFVRTPQGWLLSFR